MSKRKKKATLKKAAEARQIKRQQQIQSNKGGKFLRLLKNTKIQVSFLIGIVSFLFVVWPRISIYPGEPLDPYQPFKTPFIIKNDGYLPIKDIHYSLTLKNVELEHDINIKNFFAGINDIIPKLSVNRTSVIYIKHAIDMPPKFLKSAEVYINLTYKPSFIPYIFKEHIRFKTDIKTTGEYVWLEYFSEK